MAKTSHLQETGTGNAMMTSLRVNSTQAWAYCMLHVTVSVACKNSVCILIVYGGYGRDKRLKLPYVSRQAGYFLMGPYSPSAVNEVDSSWCITWACNHWFPSVYIYKWGGRCSNVNVSALHKCYVVKKSLPIEHFAVPDLSSSVSALRLYLSLQLSGAHWAFDADTMQSALFGHGCSSSLSLYPKRHSFIS